MDDKLVAELEAGLKFRATTWDLLQGISVQDRKSAAVLRFVSIALQHHDSILLLLKFNNQSSALALLRCLVDASNRGSWIANFAAEEDVEQIRKGEFRYPNIGKELDEKYGIGLSQEERDMLHSLTHSGYEQVGSQLSARGQIEPDFPVGLLTAAIVFASNSLCTLCLHAFGVAGRDDLVDQMGRLFIECFGKARFANSPS